MQGKLQSQCPLPLYYHGRMKKAAPMQGGYQTRQSKRLQSLTEALNLVPQDLAGLMNRISGRPKPECPFFFFANEAGLLYHVQQGQWNQGCACASQFRNPPRRPKQLKKTRQHPVSPPGLHPPKHYQRPHILQPQHGRLGSSQPVKNSSTIFTDLKFCPDEIIYTDLSS